LGLTGKFPNKKDPPIHLTGASKVCHKMSSFIERVALKLLNLYLSWQKKILFIYYEIA
jgi:hypothetical protein